MIRRDSPTRRLRSLADEGSSTPVSHVGLAHDKFSPHAHRNDKNLQGRFIRNLAEHSGTPDGYALWFRRWVRRTPAIDAEEASFARSVLFAVSQGRVLCGLGELTPTENGLAVHHTYGVPYLPGSSLKGILRSWCEQSVSEGPWAPGGPAFVDTFGTPPTGDEGEGCAGAVAFFDALWVPGESGLPPSPFAAEIATPHFGDYYQSRRGSDAPDGTQSPVPVVFLAAQGGFRLVIEGPAFLVTGAAALLRQALEHRGVGAKSRAGYGRFLFRDTPTLADKQALEERDASARRQAVEMAFAQATTPQSMLATLAAHTDTDPRNEAVAWLTGAAHADPRMQAFEVTPRAAGAVRQWLFDKHLMGGVVKRLRGHVPDAVLQAVETPPSTDDDARARPEGFGTNHLDSSQFSVPPNSKKKAKKWPNDFSTFIANGAFDEDTVRRAVRHLRAHGAKRGHTKNLYEKYPLDPEE